MSYLPLVPGVRINCSLPQVNDDEADEFKIFYDPFNTTLADVKLQLRDYLTQVRGEWEKCQIVLSECSPNRLKEFCDDLAEWLQEEHEELQPLDVIEHWQEEIHYAKKEEPPEISGRIPSILIERR